MIRPEGDKVLVRPDGLGERIGSIFVPRVADTNQKVNGHTGTIVDIGPTAEICIYDRDGNVATLTRDMLPVRAIYAKYGGFAVQEQPDALGSPVDLRLMFDSDIAGVIIDDTVDDGGAE